MSATQVALVSMPFRALNSPSLGLALLRGALKRDGIKCSIYHYEADFAHRIGEDVYKALADGRPAPEVLAGEWVFAPLAAPWRRPELDARFFDELLAGGEECFADALMIARERAAGFVEAVAQELANLDARVIGFTSVFQQTAASVAVARRLKALDADKVVVLGGANCEASMGLNLARIFDALDYVVSGEGEVAFPRLVRDLLENRTKEVRVAGVYTRADLAYRGPTETVHSLDDLPPVSYDGFEASPGSALRIPFETSRGCWWGEKHHCIFCGLNGSQMKFRRKSNDRIQRELASLSEEFPNADFAAVDNILDLDILRSGALAGFAGRSIYFEVKANLKRADVAALRSYRVKRVQLGIESLSTTCLQILEKGTTALRNIEALKWCREYEVGVDWNLLAGIPGAQASDYLAQAEVIPMIHHLAPAHALGRLRIDRFSPLFMDPARFGFDNLEPSPAYELVFGLPSKQLAGIAYFFSATSYSDVAESAYPLLQKRLEDWQDAHDHSVLFSVEAGENSCWVFDSRATGELVATKLEMYEHLVLRACARVQSTVQCLTLGPINLVLEAIDALQMKKFLVRDGEHLLSVVLPAGPHYPGAEILRDVHSRLAERNVHAT